MQITHTKLPGCRLSVVNCKRHHLGPQTAQVLGPHSLRIRELSGLHSLQIRQTPTKSTTWHSLSPLHASASRSASARARSWWPCLLWHAPHALPGLSREQGSFNPAMRGTPAPDSRFGGSWDPTCHSNG